MQGIAPPNGCCRITFVPPGVPSSMEVTVAPNAIGWPVGSATRADHPEAGVIYKDAVSGRIWIFTGGPTAGTWHELNTGGADRMGTWGPC